MKRRTFLQMIGAVLAVLGLGPRDEWLTLNPGPYVWTTRNGRIVSRYVFIIDEASGEVVTEIDFTDCGGRTVKRVRHHGPLELEARIA